jgi:CRISPR-associated endonuclease Csn1
VDVKVRGGAAERGEMARVDVFRKQNKKGVWQYFLVPIYPHEIAELDVPPNMPVPDGTPALMWPSVDDSVRYIWALNQLSYIEVIKPDGEVIHGYFRSLNRNTGAINISPQETLQK